MTTETLTVETEPEVEEIEAPGWLQPSFVPPPEIPAEIFRQHPERLRDSHAVRAAPPIPGFRRPAEQPITSPDQLEGPLAGIADLLMGQAGGGIFLPAAHFTEALDRISKARLAAGQDPRGAYSTASIAQQLVRLGLLSGDPSQLVKSWLYCPDPIRMQAAKQRSQLTGKRIAESLTLLGYPASEGAVHDWIAGSNRVFGERVVALATVLDVPTECLYADGPPIPPKPEVEPTAPEPTGLEPTAPEPREGETYSEYRAREASHITSQLEEVASWVHAQERRQADLALENVRLRAENQELRQKLELIRSMTD